MQLKAHAYTRSKDTLAEELTKEARTWCIASPIAGDDKLNTAIDYYCKQPRVDCSVIRPGGPCYQPNSVREHASVVLNLYYKSHNGISPYCPADVGGISIVDPSKGSCKYP
ncbi:hypothetical protein RHGRI_031984 [Rhododendron griersonianum]|uniref:X8 domain-containing protein n=1 Tax=Rhododendron griersonianum TaxID=479676 RepID=A0AAV6ID52_9ERIC|nr:hypothetical protein RHGRI_031984 [Rhododendron griersonianum]